MKSKEFYSTPAWKIFSKYIKLYHSNKGITRCITSGKFLPVNSKECHCGHLIKVFDGNSTNFAVAFDEDNVRPQLLDDNRFHGGKQDIFYRNLLAEIGKDRIEGLYIKRHNSMKLDKFTLDLIYKEYKKKFDDIVKIKGNPWKK